jgi:hypothetical protein
VLVELVDFAGVKTAHILKKKYCAYCLDVLPHQDTKKTLRHFTTSRHVLRLFTTELYYRQFISSGFTTSLDVVKSL